jgi:hypothetical protein
MSNKQDKEEKQEEGKSKEEKDNSVNKLLYSYPLGTKLKVGARRSK